MNWLWQKTLIRFVTYYYSCYHSHEQLKAAANNRYGLPVELQAWMRITLLVFLKIHNKLPCSSKELDQCWLFVVVVGGVIVCERMIVQIVLIDGLNYQTFPCHLLIMDTELR